MTRPRGRVGTGGPADIFVQCQLIAGQLTWAGQGAPRHHALQRADASDIGGEMSAFFDLKRAVEDARRFGAALADPRSGYASKLVLLLGMAYPFTSIDLIPNRLPVIGYFDQVAFVVGGVALSYLLSPAARATSGAPVRARGRACPGRTAGMAGRLGARRDAGWFCLAVRAADIAAGDWRLAGAGGCGRLPRCVPPLYAAAAAAARPGDAARGKEPADPRHAGELAARPTKPIAASFARSCCPTCPIQPRATHCGSGPARK